MFGGVGVLMHFTQISFYALMLLHREVFTHRLLYTQRLSLKEAFTHRSAPARALRPDLHCCCLLPLPDLVFSFPNHCLAPLVLLVCDYRKKRHKNCRCSRTKTVRPNMYICFRSTFKSFPEGTWNQSFCCSLGHTDWALTKSRIHQYLRLCLWPDFVLTLGIPKNTVPQISQNSIVKMIIQQDLGIPHTTEVADLANIDPMCAADFSDKGQLDGIVDVWYIWPQKKSCLGHMKHSTSTNVLLPTNAIKLLD